MYISRRQNILSIFSKVVAGMILFLILAGGTVTSTDSGLSVPDWPLAYGMLFPPMVGGVFFEHGHRLAAGLTGLLMIFLAVLVGWWETRRWVKVLAYTCLGLVVFQGVMGGLTVLFLLPLWISTVHAVISQTLFGLTVFLAYSLSGERERREAGFSGASPGLVKMIASFIGLVFLQLIIGSLLRHSESGLAIPDFPRMAGTWVPHFNRQMLDWINLWRFDHGLEEVTMAQVWINFIHRLTAVMIVLSAIGINRSVWKKGWLSPRIKRTVLWLDLLLCLQVSLGIGSIWSMEDPLLTTAHVVCGALVLGMSVLLFLRSGPLSLRELRT